MMICSCGDFANRNGTQMALCHSGNRISPARAHLRLKSVTASRGNTSRGGAIWARARSATPGEE